MNCREAAPAHDSSHAALCLLLLARVQKNPTHRPIWVGLSVIFTHWGEGGGTQSASFSFHLFYALSSCIFEHRSDAASSRLSKMRH